MSVPDLSKVTSALKTLLEEVMPRYRGWPETLSAPTVGVKPPDDRGSVDLSLYLYHVSEDPHFRNDPGDSPTSGTNKDKPLPLSLYYQLSAAPGDDDDGAFNSQIMMSFAMRTLHDHAIVTDDTLLPDGRPLLKTQMLQGRQNRLRISLRPVPPDDAVDYWTAGRTSLRLAAYYQVSVVMIEPEPPVRAAGPVLTYGAGVFASTGPTLSGSRSEAAIVVADEPAPRTITLTPAQVTHVASPSETGGRFELEGSQLLGEGTGLRLRSGYGIFVVDATAWGIVASAERVFAQVAENLGTIPTLPGTWSVAVLVRRSVAIGGTRRTIVHDSNETPILVAPRLDAVQAAGPTLGQVSLGGPFTLRGWRFTGSEAEATGDDPGPWPIPTDPTDPRSVRLVVAGRPLTRRFDPAVVEAGTFKVIRHDEIEAWLPADLDVGSFQPVQVWVNGAASTPRWLEVRP